MVLAVFPHQAIINVRFPRRDEGLAARDWRSRVEYVEAFRLLVSSWPGDEALRLKHMSVGKCERDVLEVEKVAYPFYCRTFFEYLGRAPCTPHRLPM